MFIDALQYIAPSRAVFEQMRAGRLSAVHVTVGYHEDFLGVVQNLQVWNRWFEDCSDVIARAVTCEEIRAANAAGKTAILFGLQNPLAIGADIGRVEILAQLGIRFCQITYNQQSLLGAGCFEPDRALDECFDLFASLDANEAQLDFPVLYASGRAGWADEELDGPRNDLSALFELIVRHVKSPKQAEKTHEPFSMLATTLGADPFIGRILTGRVETGRLKAGDSVKALSRDGGKIEQFRCTKILAFRGLAQQAIDEAVAGDIVSLAGMTKATVADTICAPEINEALPSLPIDPPTISVTFGINDSPLAGRDGKKVQSRVIRKRLMEEAETNVAIRVTDTPSGEAFEVAGRGELQMGVLIENMRREGFELSISRPRVLFKEEDGQRLEPIEEVTVDVDEEYSGVVIEKLTGFRKGDLAEMKSAGAGKTRIIAHVPSRGLIGYQGEFMTDTRGTGVLNRVFHTWAPHKGAIPGRRAGVLISMENGVSVPYAIFNLEDRGKFFIGSQEDVYQGMIIGEHNRENDLEVNPLKGKKLTNVRASGTDEAVRLTTPIKMSLEEAIAYIDNDELVEVTPNAIRLRKIHLDPHERKRASRSA